MDRLFLRFSLACLVLLSLLWARPACASWSVDGDGCDPSARSNAYTPAQKRHTRERVWSTCKAIGGSDRYCSFWLAVVLRESWNGVASAVHTLGEDADGRPEYGLGPMGLSVRWHGGRWPGDDEDPAWCSPEASFLVGHAIALGAVEKFKVDDAVELQAIFGGGRNFVVCRETGAPSWWQHVPGLHWIYRLMPPKRECRANPTLRTVRSICSRMDRCRDKIARDDLGDASGLVERRGHRYIVTSRGKAWALARARRSAAAQGS